MQKILNYINGEWVEPEAKEYADVINPATGETMARTPLCGADEVDAAARAAAAAFPAWRQTPMQDRIQYLFKLRDALKMDLEQIARTITNEAGKTFEESKAEMVRAVENVEVACGMPMMSKGEIVEDIAPGIDEIMLRQPLGVCATVAPFNFPGMIPFWYLPYAIACGNTYIVKPSEKVPMTMQLIFRLIEQIGFPKGVINLVNGAKAAVDAILDHPAVRAVTFVGSTATARYLYARASASGKRVQAQGGAKNPVVILPDADMDMATKIIGVRLRGTTLPGSVAGRHGCRGARSVHRDDLRCSLLARRGVRARRGRADGAGDQPAQPAAHRAAHWRRRVGRRLGPGGRPRGDRHRL